MKRPLKVISMIPSWTETLIHCGVNVVGRTRFCIHPEEAVRSIPIVGGTKDIQWDKVKALNPDILLLDKEENLKFMSEQAPCDLLISHVDSLDSVSQELRKFAQVLSVQEPALESLAARFDRIISHPHPRWEKMPAQIPGEILGLRRDFPTYENIIYVIWKKPWMRIAPSTYIGSVLDHLGAGGLIPKASQNYPQFELQDWDLEKTYFMFSSEPYPFGKKVDDLRALNLQGSLVDGEAYSWFGIRSLQFLESRALL